MSYFIMRWFSPVCRDLLDCKMSSCPELGKVRNSGEIVLAFVFMTAAVFVITFCLDFEGTAISSY
jgi:hypothetical protein